jgi:hypothetical protein
MENFKISLSDLYLNEDQQIAEDGYDQRGGYEYKLKVGDRRYILTYIRILLFDHNHLLRFVDLHLNINPIGLF